MVFLLDSIDKSTLAIAKVDDEVYKDMTELADELPPNQPRFILLSYPMALVLCLEQFWHFFADSYSLPVGCRCRML